MKSKLFLLLTIISSTLFFSLMGTIEAESIQTKNDTSTDFKNTMVLSLDSSVALINGQKESAVKPIVKDGRTLVPLRLISEGFGAVVDFNTKSQSIRIQYSNKTILMKIKNKNITIDGKTVVMDVPANIYNGSTYIPLRYIGEALNKKVVYQKSTETQPYRFIIIRDVNTSPIEESKLIRVYGLTYEGKNVIYSDKYLVITKENNKLRVSQDFYTFNDFSYHVTNDDKNTVHLGDIWFKTEKSDFYLIYDYNTTQKFILYQVNGESISRVAAENVPIKSVKTYLGNVYYLTQYQRGLLDADQTTNLKYATHNNGQWSSDYLGKPGFYYGFDTLGKVYDWPIDKDGISTFGYQRAGNLSSDERKKTFGQYKIKLSGHQHELLKP
ncbi:copper amine oxidase N-terminal domain-containing protein [Paenibacillus cellulositrophicus]|uniref:copper amine oxidase N-terminal domain-containing protein n=1 Tax=Paenibacillus cellulositrophicus TaxID=562959 RepID=UPI00126728CF|nr:copper amine oxidase N-terminal domain-containing protein [Paenibacillus cellulositrophicus]